MGAKLLFAPDSRTFTSLQISEAGWGGKEGFVVWEQTDTGPRELSRQVAEHGNDWTPRRPFARFAYDRRLDSWHVNECVAMSTVRISTKLPYNSDDARTVYSARAAQDWVVRPSGCVG
ncbi:MAG: hypothetical protein WBA68_03740 [Alteraurantiacibacter sp.]